MINNIMYSDTFKKYLHLGPIQCTECSNLVTDAFKEVYIYAKKESTKHNLCMGCFNLKTPTFGLNSTKIVIITNKLPDDARPVIYRPPTLGNSSNTETTFSAAELKSTEVNDKTKLSNRETWEGSSIGAIIEDQEKDRAIELEKVDKILNLLHNVSKESVSILEERKRKKLV